MSGAAMHSTLRPYHVTTSQPVLSHPSLSPNFTTPIDIVNQPPANFSTSPADIFHWFMAIIYSSEDDSEEDKLKRWSSFIGIIVAISGNILISLALNVQKYAHIRLQREKIRRQQQLRRVWKRQAWKRALLQNGTPFRRASERRLEEVDNREGEDDIDGLANILGEDSAEDYYDSDNQEEYVNLGGGVGGQGAVTGLLPHQDTKETGSNDQKYLHSPWWWMGFVLMTIGECGNFLAYGFAPASIVSPLGVVALISNCIIAPVMLKEPFRPRDFMGVVVSIAGAVIVVLSSSPEEIKLGPDEILEAISQTAFEVYFAVTCALMLGLIYISRKYGSKSILIDLGLVALFGGYTVLSTKGISSLLSSSLYHIFTMPIAYLFMFILISTAILQIKYVNRALQRFDSTQVIPTQFVLFTLSVIIGSAILYRDFEKMGQDQMVKFVIGCGLTFWGVYLITSGRPERDDDDDEHGLEDGDIGLVEGEGSNVVGTAISDDDDARIISSVNLRRNQRPLSSTRRTVDSHNDSISTQKPPQQQPPHKLIHHRTSSSSLFSSLLPNQNSNPTESSPLLSQYDGSDIDNIPDYNYNDTSPTSPTTHTFIPNHFETPPPHPSRSSLLTLTTTDSAISRHSISLIPGPIVVSYQLQAVVSGGQDHMSGHTTTSSSSDHVYHCGNSSTSNSSKRISRKGSRSGKMILDRVGSSSTMATIASVASKTARPARNNSNANSVSSSLACSDGISGGGTHIPTISNLKFKEPDDISSSDGEGATTSSSSKTHKKTNEGRGRSSSLKLLLDTIPMSDPGSRTTGGVGGGVGGSQSRRRRESSAATSRGSDME